MSIDLLKILHGIDSKPFTKNIVFALFKAVALALQIDSSLLLRAEFLHHNEGSAYSCGLLYWLIRAKLKINLPRYNIYHLVSSERERIAITNIGETLKNDYRAIKQLHLVRQTETSNEELLKYVKNRIEKSLIENSKKNTNANVVFNKKLALEALECCQLFFAEILNKKCFLVSGTLLGLLRDQDFVDGDYDIDLGFFESDVSKDQVYKKLKQSPYFDYVNIRPHLIKAKHKNGVVIDFFAHYQEGQYIWHGSKIHRWYNSNFFLHKAIFKGIECYIPSQPERYLEENYGGWEYPVSYWNYSFDTPNQKFPKNIETLFYLTDTIIEQFDENHHGTSDRYVVTRALNSIKETFGIDLTHYLPSQTPHPVLDGLKKKKVVITFGTFDLFHIGHLNIINRAALLGDRLVIGVSSDSLNYRKKGEYPTYSENDRMKIVEAIDGVDQVFLEESLEQKREYILNHGASVLVMGDDWKGKFDEFNDICQVVYLPRTELVSTTGAKKEIIRKHFEKP